VRARMGAKTAGAGLSPRVEVLAAAVLAPVAPGLLKLAAAWLFAIGAVATSAGMVYRAFSAPQFSALGNAAPCTPTAGVVGRER